MQKEDKIKEPKQARSIEKKNRIIETGFRLFCEKGYYHTNTAEIARAAGVSTGIVYRYFPDKHAIFVDAIQLYSEKIQSGILTRLNTFSSLSDLDSFLPELIDSLVDMHVHFAGAHRELEVMANSDPDISNIIVEFERSLTDRFADSFAAMDNGVSHVREKIHLVFHMIEDYCHEVVFHHHEHMDYTVMKELLLSTLHCLIRL